MRASLSETCLTGGREKTFVDGIESRKRLVLSRKSLRNKGLERFSSQARLGKRRLGCSFARFPSRLLGLPSDVGECGWLRGGAG